MKAKLFLLMAALFLVSIGSSYALTCSITQDACVGENKAVILCLSDNKDGFVEFPVKQGNADVCPNYPWKVCCEDSTYISNECKGNYAVAAYADAMTGATLSANKEEPHTIPLCISGLRSATCTDSNRNQLEAKLGYITGEHRFDAEGGATTISCSLDSDGDDDGFSANQDCNDDDAAIRPEAVEIGDGVDNDCDGLMDGDDPDLEALPKGWYQLSAAADQDLFADYTSEGIAVEELPGLVKVFRITGEGKKALVSSKVRIEQNKEYVASINASCPVTVQLAFDNTVGDEEDASFWERWIGQIELVNSRRGAGEVVSVVANSGQANFASIVIVAETQGCVLSNPQLELKGRFAPSSYNDLYAPTPKDQFGATHFTSSACCPANTCWNGFTCIENMQSNTFLVENVSGKSVYRCENGQWNFLARLYDWNQDKFGSCPGEGQCFVQSSLEGAQPGATAEDFYTRGITPTCVNNGTFLFDHYCDNGNWTSRTKLLASTLLNSAEGEDYVIYCTDFRDALLDTERDGPYLGGTGSAVSLQRDAGALTGGGNQAPLRVCFNGTNTALVRAEENTCINNACVLVKQDGSRTIATSLNKPITDSQSFLNVFGINLQEIVSGAVCQNGTGFVPCAINARAEGQLLYSRQLNAIIYSKETIDLDGTFGRTVIQWLRNLFGLPSPISREASFVDNAQNIRELYVLTKDGKIVRALKEVYPEVKQGLVAEYEGFTTPVCEYVTPRRMKIAGFEVELLEEEGPAASNGTMAAGRKKLVCVANETIQRIDATADEGSLRQLWPQLTGRLRVK